MSEPRRTPLHDVQAARGARFLEFAGWQLPVQFEGVSAEHHAVRRRAGLFDVSHMGELIVEGPQALAGLQYALTNDLGKLVDGKALYTVMCYDHGGIVDDLIVYRERVDRYFLVVNGGRREADRQHLTAVLEPFDCDLFDVSDDYALLALQGPRAGEILAATAPADVGELASFAFVDGTVAGVDNVRIARTGYTGEDGVELYVAAGSAAKLWTALVEAGEPAGMALCGLGARDTLRMEMKFALYGSDIDADHNPIEAGLGWTVKMKKSDFVGRDSLVHIKRDGPQRRWIGFKLRGRGIPRQGFVLRADGDDVGVVTSGTHSPSLDEPIGLGYVPSSHAAPGSALEVVIRSRVVAAVVVETPFYKRES